MAWTRYLLAASLAAASGPLAVAKPAKSALEPTRLTGMSARRAAELRGLLPHVADESIQRLLDDPELIFYTEQEIPRAYQSWDHVTTGVHAAAYNISANGGEPHGNGNVEFPWGDPAGTHRARNMWSYRFLSLPKDEQGRARPIVWFRKVHRDDIHEGYGWRFPVGTVIGEVLVLRDPEGGSHPFEVRVRKRTRDDWQVDVFRPFPRNEDLVARIRELRPDWESQEGLKKFVTTVSATKSLKSHTLKDDHPDRVFKQRMGIDVLPALDDDLVAELLDTTPFRSALGAYWREGSNGVNTAAPTTKDDFHVVPANYDAGFVEVDRFSCMRCHETVNQHVDRFDSGRDWYGRIRGSDGIFSFHPFDPSCISYNGYEQQARLRGEFVKGGLIERYDSSKHSAEHYTRVPELLE